MSKFLLGLIETAIGVACFLAAGYWLPTLILQVLGI